MCQGLFFRNDWREVYDNPWECDCDPEFPDWALGVLIALGVIILILLIVLLCCGIRLCRNFIFVREGGENNGEIVPVAPPSRRWVEVDEPEYPRRPIKQHEITSVYKL